MGIQNIIYSKEYRKIYPILEVEPLSNSIYEYTLYIKALLDSERAKSNIDKKTSERNEKACNKTKKYKMMEKNEYGKREVFKVDTPKKGYKKEIEKYKAKIKEIEEYYDYIEEVLNRLESQNLTTDDVELIKELIYKNRLNNKFQFIIVGIILTVFVVMIILKYFI